jgi:hypothetical protein
MHNQINIDLMIHQQKLCFNYISYLRMNFLKIIKPKREELSLNIL